MYTLSEFRDNLRQAFNDAEQGHEVVIERYNQKYQLVSLVDGPLPGHSMESVPGKEPALTTVPSTLGGTGLAHSVNPGSAGVIERKEPRTVIENTPLKPPIVIKAPIIKTVEDVAPALEDFPTFTPCKHNQNPALCKYAKFDKTRKQKWCK